MRFATRSPLTHRRGFPRCSGPIAPSHASQWSDYGFAAILSFRPLSFVIIANSRRTADELCVTAWTDVRRPPSESRHSQFSQAARLPFGQSPRTSGESLATIHAIKTCDDSKFVGRSSRRLATRLRFWIQSTGDFHFYRYWDTDWHCRF